MALHRPGIQQHSERVTGMTLRELKVGQCARIEAVGGEGALRQHFLDMGITPGTEVQIVKYAPLGDPVEITVRGYELSLRKADCEMIEVTDA